MMWLIEVIKCHCLYVILRMSFMVFPQHSVWNIWHKFNNNVNVDILHFNFMGNEYTYYSEDTNNHCMYAPK